MIEIKAVNKYGISQAVEQPETMKLAKLTARDAFKVLGSLAFVEVIFDGCTKRVYGSMEKRRAFYGYMLASEVLSAKS